jgi:cysteine desulfurase
LAIQIPGVPAEVLMHHLEERGIYVSAGSACNSTARTASPGLLALGLDAESARQVLRFSFSRTTTVDEVRRGAAALVEVVRELNAVRR